jgi:hypothetical protein
MMIVFSGAIFGNEIWGNFLGVQIVNDFGVQIGERVHFESSKWRVYMMRIRSGFFGGWKLEVSSFLKEIRKEFQGIQNSKFLWESEQCVTF